MKPLLMTASFVLILLVGMAVSLWWQTHPSYSNGWLSVQAPEGGWRLSSSSNAGVAYAAAGEGPGESAFVSMIGLPADLSPEAMVEFVRHESMHDPRIARMQVVESAFEYTVARGYPCVLHRLTAQAPRDHRLRQQQALTCRHPDRPGMGIVMGFSRLSGTGSTDPAFERQAQAFFGGVIVHNDLGAPRHAVASLGQ